jgi:CRISPR/Cas system-associated exonuclease Cas4 (RecB family)
MKLSRSKIELYFDCPKCFYLDVVQKIGRPSGFPMTLNNAVDLLMKREFDSYREKQVQHPIQLASNSDYFPASDARLEAWRDPFTGGLSYYDTKRDTTYFGAIDDLWINSAGNYAVVDYKATAGKVAVTSLPTWAESYKRQLAFYAWLLKKNGLPMSVEGFFVYATADTNRTKFAKSLNFELNLIAIELDDTWIEPVLDEIEEVLSSNEVPPSSKQCKFCRYKNS